MTRPPDLLTYAERRLLAATARNHQSDVALSIAATEQTIRRGGEMAHLIAHRERLQRKYDALEKCVEKLMVRR